MLSHKPSSLHTLQGEEDNAEDSDDLGERVFLGTLTAEHCIHAREPTNEVNHDAIQSHRFGTAAILEMQLTSEPRNKHTTPVQCWGRDERDIQTRLRKCSI